MKVENDFFEAYRDSIQRNIEHFAFEFFRDNDLFFLFDEIESADLFVDGLYLQGKPQVLYLFTDKKIRKITLKSNQEATISSYNVSRIVDIFMEYKTQENAILKIKLDNDTEIILDTNNVFEHWRNKSKKALKSIFHKYY